MRSFESVTPEHVLQAMAECDALGADEFLARYGFGKAQAYVLWSDVARASWADAARDVLREIARHYHAVITYKELAAQVQQATGIRTGQLMHYWIGDVLGRVADGCASRGEPLLTSLCVNAEGSVGDGYASAVLATTGTSPADPDLHAAHERLACYRRFEAVGLPADGGSPALTSRLATSRERSRRARQAERPLALCPTCHMALPATGVCDECG